MENLTGFIDGHEAWLRLGCFMGVLVLMTAGESLLPRRGDARRAARWPTNTGLVVLNTVIMRGVAHFLPLLLPVAAAEWVAAQGWGLLPGLGITGWIAFGLSLLILDLAIFGQHVLFHKIPALWRLHRVHHTDRAFDATTGIRFHPIEILLSAAIRVAIVCALGAPGEAVVVFEVLLSATSLFNHANLHLPGGLDRAVRLILVTPDMHRVHHSMHRDETDSNFGFTVPWWDRLFATYRAQPRDGHEKMEIGVREFQDPDRLTLGRLLVQPFGKNPIAGTPPPSPERH